MSFGNQIPVLLKLNIENENIIQRKTLTKLCIVFRTNLANNYEKQNNQMTFTQVFSFIRFFQKKKNPTSDLHIMEQFYSFTLNTSIFLNALSQMYTNCLCFKILWFLHHC